MAAILNEELHKCYSILLPVGVVPTEVVQCTMGTTISGSPEHGDIIFLGRILQLAFPDRSFSSFSLGCLGPESDLSALNSQGR